MGRRDPLRTLLPDLAIVVVFFGTLPQSICCSANVECEFYDWRPSSSNRTSSLRSQPSPVAVPESKAHRRLSVDCVSSASEQIVSPTDFNEAESIVSAYPKSACAEDRTYTLRLRVSKRTQGVAHLSVVATHEHSAQSGHNVPPSMSTARRSE